MVVVELLVVVELELVVFACKKYVDGGIDVGGCVSVFG